MLKKSLSILILTLIVLTSCKKKLPDIGNTSAVKMANEWWVTLTLGGVDQYGTHVLIKTSNTASNGNEIWVDDYPVAGKQQGNVWGFKVKAQADLTNLTFSAAHVLSAHPGYPIFVDITNGQIFPTLGRSKSGVVVDSIYMKIKFSDDPTNTYELKGHARTMLIEDDY